MKPTVKQLGVKIVERPEETVGRFQAALEGLGTSGEQPFTRAAPASAAPPPAIGRRTAEKSYVEGSPFDKRFDGVAYHPGLMT